MIPVQLIVAMAMFLAAAGFPDETRSQMFIFPEKGQTKDQQEFDQFTCSKWAKEQTGYDPSQIAAAPPPPAPEHGKAARGAAGGAAVGAIGGAIGGDAGKGAAIGAAVGGVAGSRRQRRSEMEYQHQVQEQAGDRKAAQDKFNRAYSVCLEGKGYKVG